MRRLLPIFTACVLLIIVTVSVSADKRIPAYRTPIYIPSPPQSMTVACGTHETIATVDYWPVMSDGTYTALFAASGGPGFIYLTNGTEMREVIDLAANTPPQWYTLQLTPPPGEGGVVSITLAATAYSCEARGSSEIVIRSLNIFVSP